MNEEEIKSCISSAVHELKNPLSAIQLTAELLLSHSRKMSEDDRDKHFKRLAESAVQLRKLSDDIALFSKASLLSSAFEDSPGEIVSIASEAVEACSSLEKPGLTFKIQHPPGFSCRIKNKAATHEILCRLLKNTMRTAPVDSVVVIRIGQSGELLSLEVCHAGTMPEPDLTTYDLSGKRLDLSIASILTRKAGGTLSYKSGLINETCFVLSLPVYTTLNTSNDSA